MESYNPNNDVRFMSACTEAPSEELKKVRVLLNQRAGKRSSATKLESKVYGSLTNFSSEEKASYLEAVKSVRLQLGELDGMISVAFASSPEFNFERQEVIEENNDYYQIKLGTLIKALEKVISGTTTIDNPVTTCQNSNFQGLKLPPIVLPKFNSEPEMLEQFLYSFESILSKFNLTSNYITQNFENFVHGDEDTKKKNCEILYIMLYCVTSKWGRA